MSLTPLQIRHFRDSGYLRIPGVVPAALVAEIRGMLRTEFADASASVPPRQGTPAKLYRLHERAPGLMGRLITLPGLVGPLRALLGPNVVYLLNRHNQAAVNAPGETLSRLHRDILQWTRGLVTAVVYLEDATPANGCTHLVPGSHHLPFVGVPQPDGGGTWMDEHPELADLMDQSVPVPVPAGGVLLFDALAFHTVGANTGDTSRMSLVLGFRSVDELDAHPDRDRQLLVSGRHIYRGNDRAADRPVVSG
ncbi:phytanoyl-CoA dioxygenase family protein [Streptomyces sp. DT24]|uniref:phytanoyl-CoA dioxygenase family protein n=1 Tax=unclassified Streptomyces TaxID=2593676 RepID=UPI0023B9357B|nr:phytanoyl-CoA dioxygenase family protein [Streptomyces sp. AM 4-1-1]WEH32569.1 phytanoyl-CoA dioxygenase family protein [Streptomyces sp. AM 4-1-1]